MPNCEIFRNFAAHLRDSASVWLLLSKQVSFQNPYNYVFGFSKERRDFW